MIENQKEFESQLGAYVEAYMAQKRAISGEETDEKAATAAVQAYMQQCFEYTQYVSEAFHVVEPELPQLNVYFTQDGKYNDFSRRIYKAHLESGQYPAEDEWRLFAMAHIGDAIREYYLKEDF